MDDMAEPVQHSIGSHVGPYSIEHTAGPAVLVHEDVLQSSAQLE